MFIDKPVNPCGRSSNSFLHLLPFFASPVACLNDFFQVVLFRANDSLAAGAHLPQPILSGTAHLYRSLNVLSSPFLDSTNRYAAASRLLVNWPGIGLGVLQLQ